MMTMTENIASLMTPSCLPTIAKISPTSPRGTMPQPTSQGFMPLPAAKPATQLANHRHDGNAERYHDHLRVGQRVQVDLHAGEHEKDGYEEIADRLDHVFVLVTGMAREHLVHRRAALRVHVGSEQGEGEETADVHALSSLWWAASNPSAVEAIPQARENSQAVRFVWSGRRYPAGLPGRLGRRERQGRRARPRSAPMISASTQAPIVIEYRCLMDSVVAQGAPGAGHRVTGADADDRGLHDLAGVEERAAFEVAGQHRPITL